MASASSQIKQAGTPDPLDFKRHRVISPPNIGFGPGAVLSNTVPTTVLVNIAGCLAVRLRWKISTTEAVPPNPIGALSFRYRRPPPNEATAYDATLAGPHNDVNVVKATENFADIFPTGECYLAVTFTPAGGIDPTKVITASIFDVMNQ